MNQLVDVLGKHPRTTPDRRSLARISDLIQQARSSGLAVTHELIADASVPAAIEDVVYNVVREGLTNVLEHAPGLRVNLRVDAAEHELTVEVRNHGASFTGHLAGTGTGLGLVGAAERVRAQGGEALRRTDFRRRWLLAFRMPLTADLAAQQ